MGGAYADVPHLPVRSPGLDSLRMKEMPMAGEITLPLDRDWGHVEIAVVQENFLARAPDKSLAAAYSSELYTWVPSAELRPELPKDFTLSMLCSTELEHGLRRFYPIDSFEAFITKAFVAGLAVLDRIQGLGKEGRSSYRIMLRYYQRLRRRRERFGAPLLDESSLRVSRSGRRTVDEFSILPETVGLNARGEGARWNVGKLLREGREEAEAQGISRPREEACVHYG